MNWFRPRSRVPPPTPAAPTPVQRDIESLQKDRDKRRAMLARAGRAGTILTEGQTLGSSTLLGENR